MNASAPPEAGATAPERLPIVALGSIAFATFISVTIEMLPTGLMHLMAPELGVTNAAIGLLMTVFAFTVVVTSTPLTHLTRRLPRHALLVGVLAVFALGSIGTAIAPTYELIVATRVFTGIAHGVFWAIVASYTALIAPPALLTKAVSITLGGGSAAYVLGVPIGTLLGQLFGWRLAFGALAALTLVVAVLLWRLLPRVDHLAAAHDTHAVEVQPAPTGPIAIVEEYGTRPRPTPSPRLPRGLGRVIVICVLTGVIMLAQYAAYSYITPFVIDAIGMPEATLSLVLFGYGIASAVGTAITGLLWSHRRNLGFVVTFALMLGSVGVLALQPVPWVAMVALVAWGLGMGFMPPLLQTTLLQAAPARIRDVSSALYTSGFNLGIGGGALVGGLILSSLGLGALMPFFLVVVGMSFATWIVLAARRARREAA